MSTTSASSPRTLYEARADLAYSQRYNELNERLYRRIQWFITFLGALAGTGAVASFLGKHAELGVFVSGLVAVLTVFSITVRPGERAQEFKQIFKRLQRLESKVPSFNSLSQKDAIDKLDTEYLEIIADAPSGIESLGTIAQNDVLKSLGHPEECDPLTFLQVLLNAIC